MSENEKFLVVYPSRKAFEEGLVRTIELGLQPWEGKPSLEGHVAGNGLTPIITLLANNEITPDQAQEGLDIYNRVVSAYEGLKQWSLDDVKAKIEESKKRRHNI